MCIRSLGQEDPLEKGIATHSSILAWRIPQTEEPGGLQSMGSGKESDTTERLNTHACAFLSVWGHFPHSPSLSDHCQKNRTFFFFWSHHACGILVPQPRIEPMPLALEAQSPNHRTAREVSEMEKF